MEAIFKDRSARWLVWEKGGFVGVKERPCNKEKNRETLARFYMACVQHIQKRSSLSQQEASRMVRSLWSKWADIQEAKSLPQVIWQDGFLRMYALAESCTIDFCKRLWDFSEVESLSEGIIIGHNETAFFDVDATPPGILAKFFPSCRIRKDKELLSLIAQDLEKVSHIADNNRRLLLSLAILSHGTAYRELQGHILYVPSSTCQAKLIAYNCRQHHLTEGVKTISLTPEDKDAPPIYICQGTEIWPSQPSVLGSLLVNCAEHGSATDAYKQCRERLQHHLRSFSSPPYVVGHSMGGALALQIGLYSHSLVKKVYAFNPPVPNARDYVFYHQLSEESKDKIEVIANIDDIVFWRIGAKVIGKVTLFLGKKRWNYYPVGIWDCVLLFPAFFKFVRNIHHAFFAHQRIIALFDSWVSVQLTQEEIDRENTERILRFDYLHFLPKLYDPLKVVRSYVRRFFRWKLEKEYLLAEIEMLLLHERDLVDTRTDENKEMIDQEIQLVRQQKEAIVKQLIK